MKFKVKKCKKCPFFEVSYGHGDCTWSCRIKSDVGDYGREPEYDIPVGCPLLDGPVTVVAR